MVVYYIIIEYSQVTCTGTGGMEVLTANLLLADERKSDNSSSTRISSS